MAKPKVNLGNLRDPDGNVFTIIGKVGAALQKAAPHLKHEFLDKVGKIESYGDVIKLCKEYCDVTITGGKELLDD